MKCQFPHNVGTTSYDKGCRCVRCKQEKSEAIKKYYESDLGRQTKKSYNMSEAAISRRRAYEESDIVKKRREEYRNTSKGKQQAGERSRKYYLKKFGLTPKDYDLMFTAQNGCCAICLRHQNQFKRRLAVDHCHTQGHVRKLLCSNCNAALGLCQENIQTLKNMILYVEETKERLDG